METINIIGGGSAGLRIANALNLERIGLKFESGCTVIADGIHSICRNEIFPHIKTRFAGQAIWRGITTMNWPEQYRHTYTEIWSNTRRFLFVPMDSTNIFWLAIKNAAI